MRNIPIGKFCKSVCYVLLGFLCSIPLQSFAKDVQSDVYGSWFFHHEVGSNVWVVGTLSERYDRVYFGIIISTETGCDRAIAEYSQPASAPSPRYPDGEYPAEIQLRIDEQPRWQVDPYYAYVSTGLSMDKTAAVYSITFYVNDAFTKEISEGGTLRIFFQDSERTDRFKLEGAKLALGLAKLACIQSTVIGNPTPEKKSPKNSNPRVAPEGLLRPTVFQ